MKPTKNQTRERKRIVIPERSIQVFGPITNDLLQQLTARILELRGDSSKAITVLIDSPGGSTDAERSLAGLLLTPDEEGRRCRVHTVVTGEACSAAADLLTRGDYSAAYPHGRLLFHGVRTAHDEITEETARSLSAHLASGNAGSALELASAAFRRLVERYADLGNEMQQFREMHGELPGDETDISGGVFDVAAFACVLSQKVGPTAAALVGESFETSCRVSSMLRRFRELESAKRSPSSLARWCSKQRKSDPISAKMLVREIHLVEAILSDCISQDDGWSLSGEGFEELNEWFTQLEAASAETFQEDLLDEVRRFRDELLSAEDLRFQASIEESDLDKPKIRDRFDAMVGRAYKKLQPLWSFTLSLTRGLQRDENWLRPEEAWWLGLIDEVLGTPMAQRPLSTAVKARIQDATRMRDIDRFGLGEH